MRKGCMREMFLATHHGWWSPQQPCRVGDSRVFAHGCLRLSMRFGIGVSCPQGPAFSKAADQPSEERQHDHRR
jgi:hypothetical protein